MDLDNLHLKHCDNEPLSTIGQVQNHGFLLAVEHDSLLVVQASRNAAAFLSIPLQDLVGQAVTQCGICGISDALAKRSTATENGRLVTTVEINEQAHNLALHRWQNLLILEFEPHIERTEPQPDGFREAVDALLHSSDCDELLEVTARQIQQLAGYDRTMIYRFHDDWHGEVVAEAHNGKTGPSYLGLHYPASDIPEPARKLFTVNPIRLIADVAAETEPLYPNVAVRNEQPTDLSFSVLRATSPVHIQYLKNMGVAASMTISLLVDGELWGLIACHHSTPRLVDYRTRQTCNQVGELFCSRLQLHLSEAKYERRDRTSAIGSHLARYSFGSTDIASSLTSSPHTILELVECSGAAACLAGKLITLGRTPDANALNSLLGWLRTHQQEGVFATEELSAHFPEAHAYKDTASGLLSAAIAQQESDFILWFKPEVINTLYWGGNPDEPAEVQQTPSGVQVSPRRSFEKWAKQMQGRSTPWRDAEVGSVHRLRNDLLQVIAHKSREVRRLHDELETAYRQLDTFSYTVSHDLRTPLNAVRVYSEILLDELESGGSGTQLQAARKITRNADRMSNLINAVLDYSRARKASTQQEVVDVEALIQPILDDLRIAYRNHEITFNIGNLPPVRADKTMLGQVFSNLLSNAVKYSCNRDRSIVHLRGELTSSGVVYSVQDNGIGIATENADQVFQLFSRLCPESEYEGHGVGMTIVKKIMDRHQGHIWFASEPGAGATFFVEFPRQTGAHPLHPQ